MTCKNEEDPIKNEGAKVLTSLYNYQLKQSFTYSRTFHNILMICWLSGERSLPIGLLVLLPISRNFNVSVRINFLFLLVLRIDFYCGTPGLSI